MKRWTQFALAAGLALAVNACAGDRAPDADQKAPVAREGTAGTSGTSAADVGFVQEQLAKGKAEIELGKLAQERGTHPDVKRYGEMMMTDHHMAGEELKQTVGNTDASRAEAGAAAKDHDKHAELREELAKLSGHEFDRRYIDQMIEDHDHGIAELERKAERADNPKVREWAATTLPKMRQHLAKAKAIQDTLKNDRKS